MKLLNQFKGADFVTLAAKTKDIIKYFNFEFNKNLGQNFLTDGVALNKIMDTAGIDDETFVIEIGAGIGTLTQEMAKRAFKVCAVEIDKELVKILKETLLNFNNVEIVHMDALNFNFNEAVREYGDKKIMVVANLPYYITTPILTKILTSWKGVNSITVMVQKEAAQRIMADPSTHEYGPLSITANYYANVKKAFNVSRSCFIPQPRVDSQVIKMSIRKKPAAEVYDEKLFFTLIKTSFNMRRKTLLNVLKTFGLSIDELVEVFNDAEIDSSRRGETLSIDEFADLSNSLKNHMK